MYNSQEIAEKIKFELRRQNISVKEMLGELNMGINTISELSKGKQISYISFAKIADYLNCSVDYLLGRDKYAGAGVQITTTDLSNDKRRLLAMYDMLSDMGKGEILGQLDERTKNIAEAKNAKAV